MRTILIVMQVVFPVYLPGLAQSNPSFDLCDYIYKPLILATPLNIIADPNCTVSHAHNLIKLITSHNSDYSAILTSVAFRD